MSATKSAPSNPSDARREVARKNYEEFSKKLPELLPAHRGKFAVMRDGEVIEFFDTAGDAYLAGQKLYPDGGFSVQEVTDVPVDLGFFSHAVPQ
ncbi:MAG TPA: hypothetical protein VGJ84_04200 [Polyangiaceae bacterium]|jgi:hypothetical protein